MSENIRKATGKLMGHGLNESRARLSFDFEHEGLRRAFLDWLLPKQADFGEYAAVAGKAPHFVLKDDWNISVVYPPGVNEQQVSEGRLSNVVSSAADIEAYLLDKEGVDGEGDLGRNFERPWSVQVQGSFAIPQTVGEGWELIRFYVKVGGKAYAVYEWGRSTVNVQTGQVAH